MITPEHKPEELVKPEFLDTYKKLHKDIYYRLCHINDSILILETLSTFPFRFIYAPRENNFWTMVYWNFLYTSIVLLHALVNDTTKDSLTLPRLKNMIRKNWLKSEFNEEYDKRTKTIGFSSEIKEKIKQMRHNIIAHKIFDSQKQVLPEILGVSLAELRSIYNSAEQLFQACSFGCEYGTTFYLRDKNTIKSKPDDLLHIFDLLVKNSEWLNRPEKKSEYWKQIRQYKPPDDLKELNRWRQKFGMTEV